MSKEPSDQYSPEEAARRRDEVVRRMANTPPQPRPTDHHKKKEPEVEPGRAPRKIRSAGRT